MKKLITVLVILSCGLTSVAQPLLEYSNVGYKIYTNYVMHGSNMGRPTLIGNSLNWQYDTLIDAGGYTVPLIPPGATPKDSFPLSNVAVNTGPDNYFYYKSDIAGLELRGASLNGIGFIYTDPEVVLPFPFSFGNSFNDNWRAEQTSASNLYRIGSTNIVADGYGTLKLPNGTYKNILRVKSNQNYIAYDTTSTQFTHQSESVNWYMSGVHYPVAQYSQSQIDNNPIIELGLYQDPIVGPTAVGNISTVGQFINYYPNPAKDGLTITVKKEGNFSIELTDLKGATLLKKSIGNQEKINLSNIANGNYLLHLLQDDKRMAGEFITVQH